MSAKPDDLPDLVDGLIAFDQQTARAFDPVLAATSLAFGFVYVHPFEDGNGRVHRYLIHHVLTERDFNPPGVTFPVSAAILDRIRDYRTILEDYSTRLLPVVDWKPTEKGNVTVLNDTADFYRFFDATAHAEFLYECVQHTIEHDLPKESRYLQRYDDFNRGVNLIVDMPERVSNLLLRFLRQNGGTLSRRGRTREFARLTENEVERVEALYRDTFGGEAPTTPHEGGNS